MRRSWTRGTPSSKASRPVWPQPWESAETWPWPGCGLPPPAASIAATNADLKARVTAKTFREDLYYRLSVLPIALPGLAERRDDAPVIAEHLCGEICQRHGFAPLTLARRALQACRDAAWPGNVRELAHALEAAVIRANGAGSELVLEQ